MTEGERIKAEYEIEMERQKKNRRRSKERLRKLKRRKKRLEAWPALKEKARKIRNRRIAAKKRHVKNTLLTRQTMWCVSRRVALELLAEGFDCATGTNIRGRKGYAIGHPGSLAELKRKRLEHENKIKETSEGNSGDI